ncbi:MAG: ArsR family transcriptional regulator [Methanoregula sp.]|nr:ArsR family transcriptional regulator [Methanoregula sp.]
MIEKTIQVFTEKEDEFVDLLIRIGTQKTIAKTLVYLAKMKEASTRNIELGADLRQPEVSVAMKYLAGKGWVKSRQVPPEKKGRPIKIWNLNVPVGKILDTISREKQDELKTRLEMIRKVRSFA